MTELIFAIDFDGSVVVHSYPAIGADIGAVPVLKELTDKGHKLILSTMRSDFEPAGVVGPHDKKPKRKTYLTDAVNWFKQNDIPLYGIQTNPTQSSWTSSPKVLANIYIGDDALGCPLKFDGNISQRPFIDWTAVRDMLVQMKILD